MNPVFELSVFKKVYFPDVTNRDNLSDLVLRKMRRYAPPPSSLFADHDVVVFDFETTGLDYHLDEIIEIGAIRYRAWKEVARFETLVKPQQILSSRITEITGLKSSDLEAAPTISEVMPKFLDFFESSLLLAHNADFDLAFLSNAAARLGHELDFPCFCSLRLARELLPNLESKNLDTLAEFFGLGFEARHRSIGDVKVTAEVVKCLLSAEGRHLVQLKDFENFRIQGRKSA